MMPLSVGAVLQDRYQIAALFGAAEGTAAYLADDLQTRERLLIWESAEQFKLRDRPPGVRAYWSLDGRHYLALRLEGQSLAMLLTASGRVEEVPAGTWLLEISRAIGYWHNREEGALICLRQGDWALSSFYLSSHDLVMIPSYGDFGRAATSDLPADVHRFSAPEQGEALTARSDVYALGAMLYCLLTGQPPALPAAQSKARIDSPRRINPAVSTAMDKVVMKALQPDPQRRYPTAAEMADDLDQLLIPQLVGKKPVKKKPSLLMRVLPFFATLMVLACLLAVSQAVAHRELLKLPRLAIWPTPTYTPVTPATPGPTSTPTPTPSPMPIAAVDSILNQIRLDQFPEVVAYASVLDINREPVRNLTQDQFLVRQDDTDVMTFTVSNVDAATDPLAMVIAIDVSGSMKGDPIAKARQAAANFCRRFAADDRVLLFKFNHKITLVSDFTTDKDALVKAIGTLEAGGDTALYDVIAQSADRLSQVAGRRAIIVLSDGRDTASAKNAMDDAIARANGVGIPVFVVGLDSSQFTPDVLEKIAGQTGGDYLFAPEPDALDTLYQKIRGQLQNQYRVQFRSLHVADGAVHRLRIGVRLGPGQDIWAEKDYRAP